MSRSISRQSSDSTVSCSSESCEKSKDFLTMKRPSHVLADMQYDSKYAPQLYRKGKSSFQQLGRNLIVRISEYCERMDHFRIWVTVSKDLYRLFSAKRYFNSALRLNKALYERDATYFRLYIRDQLLTKRNTILILTHDIIGLNAGYSTNGKRLRDLLRFYLIFYDRFRVLQRRYQSTQMPPRRNLKSKNSLLPPQTMQPTLQTRVSLNTAYCEVFPAVLRCVTLSDTVKLFTMDDAMWLYRIWHYIGTNNMIAEWNLSFCHIDDAVLRILGASLVSRRYFCNFTLLNFRGNYRITDASMKLFFSGLAMSCPKIYQVDFSETSIGDRSCSIIASYFQEKFSIGKDELPNILWHSSKISNDGEQRFLQTIAENINTE